MKKNATFCWMLCGSLSLAAAAGGCQNDHSDPAPENNQGTAKLTVNTDNSYGSELTVYWHDGDELSVFAGKSHYKYNHPAAGGDIPGEFRGDVKDVPQTYYAYYPYDAGNTMTEQGMSVKIPEVQTYTNAQMTGKGSNPMVGVSESKHIWMKNLCGALRIEVAPQRDISVFSITFRAGGQKVAGEASVTLTDVQNPELVMSPSAVNTVKMEVSKTGLPIAKKMTGVFYLTLPPQTYTDAEIAVQTADQELTLRLEQPLVIGRSKITKGVRVVVEEPKPTTGIDLNDPARYGSSEKEVYSNCYMIDQAGTYFLKAAVIGNGSKGLHPDGGFHTPAAGISPRSAALLWEDVEGCVSDVTLSDGGSYLIFNAAKIPANAVVAVYDGENGTGNILWSWHIWLGEKPLDQQYKTPEGNNTYLVMDRNLGATFSPASTVQADVDAMTVDQRYRCYGLMYQWGRKDPFWGSAAVTGMKNKVVYGSMSKIKSVRRDATGDQANNNLLYAIQNPVTFIMSLTDEGEWYTSPIDNLWGNPKGYEPSYPKGTKTIYDPCPVGYMVPPVNLWAAAGFDKNYIKMKTKSYGRLFLYDGVNLTWYPLAGVRWASDGELGEVGSTSGGNYWSNSVSNATCKFGSEFLFGLGSGNTFPISEYGAATGHSVRCMRE